MIRYGGERSIIMSARKSGAAAAGRRRAADSVMAAQLAKDGVKRTTFRCPITYKMLPVGAYPGRGFSAK